MITVSCAGNLVGTSQLSPFLCTNEVEPAETFSEIFTGPLRQYIINVYVSRSGCDHRYAIICHIRCIVLVRKPPLTRPCTNYINEIPGSFTGYRSSPFYCCFSSYKIEFRKFCNFKWSGAGDIRLAQSATIVGTIYPHLPEAWKYNPAYTTWSDYKISPAGQLTGTNITIRFSRKICPSLLY